MPAVIVELLPVIGLFFAIVGYCFARGALATWTHSLGYLLAWLGSRLDFRVGSFFGHVHIDLGGPFRAADHAIVTALQNWCDGAEIEVGYFLHGSEKLWEYTAQSIDYLAGEVAHTAEWIVNVRLPKWAKWAAVAAIPPALLARLVAHAVAQLAHLTLRTVHTVTHAVTVEVLHLPRALERRLAHDERLLARLAAAVAAAAGAVALPWPHGLVSPWGAIRDLRRAWARIQRRLHRLEALLGVTGLAVAMANVFGLPNWRCLTRGNVGRLMRGACGLDSAIIDLLLLGTLEAAAVGDICDFAHALTIATEAITPGLEELVVVEDALVGCHGATSPPRWSIAPLGLPAVSSGVSLAA